MSHFCQIDSYLFHLGSQSEATSDQPNAQLAGRKIKLEIDVDHVQAPFSEESNLPSISSGALIQSELTCHFASQPQFEHNSSFVHVDNVATDNLELLQTGAALWYEMICYIDKRCIHSFFYS